MSTLQAAFGWTQYQIANIELDIGDPPARRTGLIGTAAAVRINGIEAMIVTRGKVDLQAIAEHLVEGYQFNEDHIGKVMLIAPDGVEVEIPDTPEELPIAIPPAEEKVVETPPEENANHSGTQVPVRDGRPTIKYISPLTEVEDATVKPTAKPDDEEL